MTHVRCVRQDYMATAYNDLLVLQACAVLSTSIKELDFCGRNGAPPPAVCLLVLSYKRMVY